jgi:hypothetical protein
LTLCVTPQLLYFSSRKIHELFTFSLPCYDSRPIRSFSFQLSLVLATWPFWVRLVDYPCVVPLASSKS